MPAALNFRVSIGQPVLVESQIDGLSRGIVVIAGRACGTRH